MSDTTKVTPVSAKYRLPDWLGGHEVELIDEKHAAGGPVPVVLMRLVGGQYDGLVVATRKDDLVEIKPPSIDDPVEWPLHLWISETDQKVYLDEDRSGARAEVGAATLAVSVRAAHLMENGSSGVFNYVRAEVPLSADELLQLARTAWQRYQAVTGGAS